MSDTEYYGYDDEDDYYQEEDLPDYVDSYARQQQANIADDELLESAWGTVTEGRMGELQMRMAQKARTPTEIFRESISTEFNKLKTTLRLDIHDRQTLFNIAKTMPIPSMKNATAYILGYYYYKNSVKKVVAGHDISAADIVKYIRFWIVNHRR